MEGDSPECRSKLTMVGSIDSSDKLEAKRKIFQLSTGFRWLWPRPFYQKNFGIISLVKAYSAYHSYRQHCIGMVCKQRSDNKALRRQLCAVMEPWRQLLTSWRNKTCPIMHDLLVLLRPGRARLDMYAYHKNVRQNRLGRSRRNWLSSREVSHQIMVIMGYYCNLAQGAFGLRRPSGRIMLPSGGTI